MKNALNQQIIDIYRKRARRYDFTANLYYLLGYREWAYRQKAIDELNLKPGDTVVEIACGTGLNFSHYQKALGSQGKIIGVDLTDAMLAQAQRRIKEHGWKNVELVQADARDYRFSEGVNAIISTYALSLIPESRGVIEKGVEALAPGGRFSILEMQMPDNWPTWFVNAGIWLMSPFAISDEWLERRPWESIQQTMREQLTNLSITEMYFGLTYVIAGLKE
jgi:ubiquinone/menaquinone biosynthesis C-methylase UbiE